MSIKHGGVEDDQVLRSESVEVSAEFIGMQGNLPRLSNSSALEDHVLDKMRQTIVFRRIVARACFEPDAHGHGADILHALREDS